MIRRTLNFNQPFPQSNAISTRTWKCDSIRQKSHKKQQLSFFLLKLTFPEQLDTNPAGNVDEVFFHRRNKTQKARNSMSCLFTKCTRITSVDPIRCIPLSLGCKVNNVHKKTGWAISVYTHLLILLAAHIAENMIGNCAICCTFLPWAMQKMPCSSLFVTESYSAVDLHTHKRRKWAKSITLHDAQTKYEQSNMGAKFGM